MIELRTRRLSAGDRDLARRLFALMAESVGEDGEQLRDGDLDRLRSRGGFRVIAAFVGDELAGGVMAHTRPMTRTASSAVFIYAIAVRDHHRRTGVGRRLGTALREGALAVGSQAVCVPADNDEVQALDFSRALGGGPSAVTCVTVSGEAE
jgi:aminoglycoside 3-N-acetyltransferase I